MFFVRTGTLVRRVGRLQYYNALAMLLFLFLEFNRSVAEHIGSLVFSHTFVQTS